MKSATPVGGSGSLDRTRWADAIHEWAAREKIDVDISTAERLAEYAERLIAWSPRARLTGRRDPAWLLREQVVPSLLVLRLAPAGTSKFVDIGAGAGTVGITCALARPAWRVLLVESVRRKYLFLYDTIRSLGLDRVEAAWERADTAATHTDFAGAAEIVAARGMGGAERVLPLAAPFLRPGGRIALFAGSGSAVARGAGAAAEPPRTPLAAAGWRLVEKLSSANARVAVLAWERA